MQKKFSFEKKDNTITSALRAEIIDYFSSCLNAQGLFRDSKFGKSEFFEKCFSKKEQPQIFQLTS